MDAATLADLYRAYVACLNRQDWNELGRHVDERVEHNGRQLGLSGYRGMLIKDFEDIPDLAFHIELLACEPPLVAARLAFDCTPKSGFLGLKLDGRKVAFTENVFYAFEAEKIVSVWSIIDKAAIEAQLGR
ncbi:ester cyclase [Labrys sp. WJW]|uniref:ester cyclase n=1 Tax=Labrys sp. WJW TaxID=1737983 RepID=UPI000835FF2C|nr:ester cyclase [Labrys sp. WJW]OCC02091.1 ester cyclase [Labrys sp. WJW]